LLAAAAFAIAGICSAAPAHAQVQLDTLPRPTEQWNGWENLGGVTTRGPECIATQVNRIDCFTPVTGGEIVRTNWDGARWNGPTLLGGLSVDSSHESRVECVTWGADHIDCFARRNSDQVVFQRIAHAGFVSGWMLVSEQPQPLTSDPDCVSTRLERLDCFARGGDGSLMQASFDGNMWSRWTSRGGQIRDRTKPACVVFRGEINCIVVTPALTLQQVRFGATGVERRDMQGGAVVDAGNAIGPSPRCYVTVDPDPNWTGDDQIHCFAPRQGTLPPNASFLARWGWSGSGNWSLSDLGEGFGAAVGGGDWDCVVRSTQRIDCVQLFAQPGSGSTAPTTTMRHRVFRLGEGVTISEVRLPGVATVNFVRCVSWGADRLDCFVGGNNSPLLHASLTPVERLSVSPGRQPLREGLRQPPSN
jgi:hypothetical protein